MYVDRLIGVVAASVSHGRCRYCRASILWATRASTPGHPAKALPFDAPRPFPVRTETNDQTGVTFEFWPRAALHFGSCTRPRQQPAARVHA